MTSRRVTGAAGTEVTFEEIIQSTPSDLLLSGIYGQIAMPLYPPGVLQPVSLALIAYRICEEAGSAQRMCCNWSAPGRAMLRDFGTTALMLGGDTSTVRENKCTLGERSFVSFREKSMGRRSGTAA